MFEMCFDGSYPLYVKKLDPRATVPTVVHPGEDLGYDIYALDDVILPMGGSNLIPTGIAAWFPGHGLLVRDRSSMAKNGFYVVGGVIDEGYRGDITVQIWSKNYAEIKAGQKIAQMIPIPVLTGNGVKVVEKLPPSARGEKRFGSSGHWWLTDPTLCGNE